MFHPYLGEGGSSCHGLFLEMYSRWNGWWPCSCPPDVTKDHGASWGGAGMEVTAFMFAKQIWDLFEGWNSYSVQVNKYILRYKLARASSSLRVQQPHDTIEGSRTQSLPERKGTTLRQSHSPYVFFFSFQTTRNIQSLSSVLDSLC